VYTALFPNQCGLSAISVHSDCTTTLNRRTVVDFDVHWKVEDVIRLTFFIANTTYHGVFVSGVFIVCQA